MTFSFTPTELAYLNRLTGELVILAQDTDDFIWAKKAQRLRFKLTPNASVVNLKQTERGMLLFVLSRRAVNLTGTITTERDTIEALLKKVSV